MRTVSHVDCSRFGLRQVGSRVILLLLLTALLLLGVSTTALAADITPPTDVTVADHPGDDGHALDLSWTATPGAAGYRLYRNTPTGPSEYWRWDPILDGSPYETDVGNVTSYTDSVDLSQGTCYYYAVRAYDEAGVLSDYSTIASGIPRAVLPRFKASAGDSPSILLATDNSLWQAEYEGPVHLIDSGTDWLKVFGGSFGGSFFALKTDGTLWAWGENMSGQLGLGDTEYRFAPAQVGTDTDWKSVVSGDYCTNALKNDGSLWGWGGTGRETSQGEPDNRLSPTRIGTENDWKVIFSATLGFSRGSAFALKTDGSLWAWGHNDHGCLGLGDEAPRLTPTQVGTDADWRSISFELIGGRDWGVGDEYCVLGLKEDGTLWSWGANPYGQLGQGDTESRYAPTQVGTDHDWAAVGSKNYYGASYALKENGTLWAWGGNVQGFLGLGDLQDRWEPTQVGTDDDWATVNLPSGCAALFMKADGSLWTWGCDSEQPTVNYSTPVQLGSATDWRGASFTGYGGGTMAVKADGSLWKWGPPNSLSASTPLPLGETFSAAIQPPTNLVIVDHPSDNGQALDLSWTASAGASGYRLYRGTSSGGYGHEADLGNITSYVDTDLTPGQTYYYILRAYDGSGTLSDFCAEVSATPVNDGTEADVAWVPPSTEQPVTVQAAEATITFLSVTEAGAVTVTPVIPTGEVPADFRLLDTGWEVDPGTVAFGSATITFPYDEAALPVGVQESQLTIWHFNGTAWVDATEQPVDTVNNLITATVTSFSPFALVAPANEPPVLTDIVASPQVVPLGTAVTMTATFTDANAGDTHTARWDWDGVTTTAGAVDDATGAVTGSHTYSAPGVYEVGLVVRDAAGAEVSGSYQYVVVYDPAAGFVTGGGWINSPAGAYLADPALAGKATFGFEAKYQKGANLPTGNTQFQFATAKLVFKSTSYDWLVVAGAKAQYKGLGTVNGVGGYGFMLSAVDGDLLAGGKKADTFRLKIWNVADGTLVYDNQLGADETADPSTTLGGGSIVIHK